MYNYVSFNSLISQLAEIDDNLAYQAEHIIIGYGFQYNRLAIDDSVTSSDTVIKIDIGYLYDANEHYIEMRKYNEHWYGSYIIEHNTDEVIN